MLEELSKIDFPIHRELSELHKIFKDTFVMKPMIPNVQKEKVIQKIWNAFVKKIIPECSYGKKFKRRIDIKMFKILLAKILEKATLIRQKFFSQI